MRSTAVALAALALVLTLPAAAPAQSAPQAPRPDPPRGVLPPQPGTSTAQPAAPTAPQPQAPASPAPAAQPPAAVAPPQEEAGEPAPTEAVLGAPVYPGAVFLRSYSAGQGQRYYLFGSADSYAQVVAFYRQALKSRGSEVYDIPPIWTFDLGRFREETMAYPPSVVVRDHVAGGQQGFLYASGSVPQRFPTVIQVVPPPLGVRR